MTGRWRAAREWARPLVVAGGAGAALAALAALALGTLGCGPAPAPAASGPVVILISLDTVRADVVGGDSSATPHLDRLASRSVVFSSAVTELPFTLPAHMSMLTGVAPDVHGVFGEGDRLPRSQPTLAELLRDAGFRTGAVVSSDWLDPGFGFGRGFEDFEIVPLGLSFAPEVNDRGLALLDAMPPDGGRFLFLHYYDAHSDFALEGNRWPYRPPNPVLADLEEACGDGLCAPDGACATGFLLWATQGREILDPGTVSCLWDAYREGVRELDRVLGRLFDGLRERGLHDDALIVVTADHGEEFGEHGHFIHGQTFGETVSIPMLLKLPGNARPAAVPDVPAQLADVTPTVLALLELQTPEGLTGQHLLARESGGGVAVSQNKYRRERYALATERWKLIHDFVDQRSRLFDLVADPKELDDVAAAYPEEVARLLSVLERRIRGHQAAHQALVDAAAAVGASDPVEGVGPVLDAEQLERLKDLGYLQ